MVVTTEGFSDKTLVDDLVPHGQDLKLTERIRLCDKGTPEDRTPIEYMNLFTKPRRTVVTCRRLPDALFQESVCLDSLDPEHRPAGKEQ